MEYPQLINSQLKEIVASSEAVKRQFKASDDELISKAVSLTDPIGDDVHAPVRGIVHRYSDRVLLMTHYSCPSVCRFCFRKTKIGQEPALTDQELEAAIEYITSHEEIFEVILSGGEPLIMPFDQLKHLLQRIQSIGHVGVTRIHTRLPLTAPHKAAAYFNGELELQKPLNIVVHCNHADEIGEAWIKFARDARCRGISLLSQSVLLAGVNDSVEQLEQLFRKLLTVGVKPYYLHHPDQVIGTDHFRVSLERGRMLFNQLRGRLSGMAIPRYILDLPGGGGKVSAESEMLVQDEGHYVIKHRDLNQVYDDSF